MFIKENSHVEEFHALVEGVIGRYVYKENDTEVAKLSVCTLEGQTSVYIDYLEVYEPYRKKGLGLKIVSDLFTLFPDCTILFGMAEESVMFSFWSKQKGFRYIGEGHDETEGYLYFEIHKSES